MTNPQPSNYHVWTRGDRLRAARENTNGAPNQADFAKMLGVSRNTVSRYEQDEPGADKPIVFHRWAEVTGYDLEWLLYGAVPHDPNGVTARSTRARGRPRPKRPFLAGLQLAS